MGRKVWRWIFVGIAVLLALAIAALIWYSVTQKNNGDMPADQPPAQVEPSGEQEPEKTEDPTEQLPEQTEDVPEQTQQDPENTEEPSSEPEVTEGTTDPQYPTTGPNGMGWN